MNNNKNCIYDTLSNLRSDRQLKDLFFDQLNYDHIDQPLPSRQLGENLQNLFVDDPLLLGNHDQFQIIYCTLHDPRLPRGQQRLIVEQILKHHPWCLVVFTNSDHSQWQFVNVKHDPHDKRRNLFRRIVVGKRERIHTAAERLAMIHVDDESLTAIALQTKHDQAFDVESVSKEFYKKYQDIFNETVKLIQNGKDYEDARSYANLLFSRLMFLYFVQRKGWLRAMDGQNFDHDFIFNLWQFYRNHPKRTNIFYEHWLKPLFFNAFKNKPTISPQLPYEVQNAYNKMPHLNGGLFSEDAVDAIDFIVPDEIFEELIAYNGELGFLERYNFTVREDLPLDREVALDHEMLGEVYENVILADERGSSGMFSTHRTEVDFMCRSALIEYLADFNLLPKDSLIEFIYNIYDYEYRSGLLAPDAETLRQMKNKLDDVRIVDPACGSGAFLVGMLRLLSTIHCFINEHLGDEINLFDIRKRIIQKNLYGVDVKDWAVTICELRLWLTLIIEAGLEQFEDNGNLNWQNGRQRPILPNLTFNIRQGDSLVEEINGKPVALRSEKVGSILSPNLNRQLIQIQNLKSQYFNNQNNITRENVEKVWQEFVDLLFREREQEISTKMKTIQCSEVFRAEQEVMEFARMPKTGDLLVSQNKELAAEKQRLLLDLEQQLKNIRDVRTAFKPAQLVGDALWRKRGFFLWELDFAEIFYQRGGFDIVIGNPPYVRQEQIAYPTARADNYSEERWREMKREYKEKLIRSVILHWQNLKIDRKCDLYIYFFLHGLALLRRGGVFCFITSNSWLDVGYGATLQKFLLENIEVLHIYDNHAKRAFASADINTVISLFRRPKYKSKWLKEREQHTCKFVAFKKPFEVALTPENICQIDVAQQVLTTEDFRVFPKSYYELFQDGVEEKDDEQLISQPYQGKYVGGKWGGKYLRAPDIFFTILEKGKGKLVRLGDIADVRFGIKTGANEFFYLDEAKIRQWGIEEEFLKPVVKSPRECKRIIIDPNDLKYKVLMCHKSKQELKGTAALEYINWGESKEFNERPSCRGRVRWWDLGIWEYPDMLWSDAYNARFACYENPGELYGDKRFFYISFNKRIGSTKIFLNSTIIPLFIEVEGIVNLGEGAVYTNVYWLKRLPVLLDLHDKSAVSKYHLLTQQKLGDIFEEIKSEEHQAVDDIIFNVLRLTKIERQFLYNAVIQLVNDRLNKAQSIK